MHSPLASGLSTAPLPGTHIGQYETVVKRLRFVVIALYRRDARNEGEEDVAMIDCKLSILSIRHSTKDVVLYNRLGNNAQYDEYSIRIDINHTFHAFARL